MKVASLESPYLKALFYGSSGSTKTRTSYSAALDDRFHPVLALESAGNPISVRDYKRKPTILTMEALGDFSYPYDYFINGQPETHEFGKALKELGKYPDQPFKTLIIDGTTEVQRFAFRAVVPGMDVPPGHVVAGVERQQFGKVLAIMINWAYKFIQLDMNVILTSLEDERADAVGNTIRKPLLWGQSGGEIGSYTYLIARLAHISKLDTKQKAEMRESNLTIETDTTSVAFFNQGASFVAKDQYHMLDEEGKSIKYMMDPTIGKIWDAIQRNQNP